MHLLYELFGGQLEVQHSTIEVRGACEDLVVCKEGLVVHPPFEGRVVREVLVDVALSALVNYGVGFCQQVLGG